jgi:hypothetical protein
LKTAERRSRRDAGDCRRSTPDFRQIALQHQRKTRTDEAGASGDENSHEVMMRDTERRP